jgi:hypothetical protein
MTSTPEYFLRKGKEYFSSNSNNPSKPLRPVQIKKKVPQKDVAQSVNNVDMSKYLEARHKQKRNKKDHLQASLNCPFSLNMPRQYPRSVKIKEGIDIFPFQYAFQQQRIPRELRQALYDWSIIWPVQSKSRLDNKRGYIFNDEESYYKEYGTSIFAYTYRKGGWESMRHYEIMCNGAIPYFIDIDKMPPHTMTRFPKELIINAMSLPGIDPIKGTIDHKVANIPCLHDVRESLLDYCAHNLSTKALAKYFLAAMGKPNARKVLMINGRQQWEYMTDSLLHGLRTLLGSGFVDYKKRLFMYKGLREKALESGFREYGKGFSYAYALPDDKNIERDPETIRMQIKSRYFDIIIIGQLFQPVNLPAKLDWETSNNLSHQMFWKEISRSYGKHEVALLDGLDYHKPEQRDFLIKAARYGTLFVREIDRHVIKGVDNMSWKAGSETATKIWEAKISYEAQQEKG